jgi:ACS family hexuronate transporter-like MFS transporter
VTRALPPGERARGTGVLFTGSSIGAMIVPPLAAYLSDEYSWQTAFLGTAAAGLLWVPLWLWSTKDAAVQQVLAPPAADEVQPQVGFATLLALPAVRRAMAVVLASAPTAAFVLLWGAKYLVRSQHVLKVEAGDYLWLPPVFYDLASVGFGDQATRRRPRRRLVGLAGCLCAMVGVLPWMSTPWQGAFGLAIAHAGVGGLFALVTSQALSAVPSVAVARTGGILAATQSLAYIVTNLLIGSSIEATHSYKHSVVALSAWVVPGVLYWILSKR